MNAVTGKTLAAFKDRIEVGDELRCLDNSYIPSREGGVLTVLQKTTNVIMGTFAGDALPDTFGGYGIRWPARVSDVVDLSADRITYRIPDRAGHTATWERLP